MAVYESGTIKIELVFNASKSNPVDWFSLERLITSPWSDIYSEPKNFFSLQGGCDPSGLECRSIFINRNYGGCYIDAGWLVVASIFCPWDRMGDGRNVMYSKRSTYAVWSSSGEIFS